MPGNMQLIMMIWLPRLCTCLVCQTIKFRQQRIVLSLTFLSGVLQDDSCTWSPEQLQMAVGFPPEDFAEEASLARAESAESPGQMHSTATLTHSLTLSLTHSLSLSLSLNIWLPLGLATHGPE